LIRVQNEAGPFSSFLRGERLAKLMVIGAMALLLAQALPYFQHRWVEDESWYSIPGYTLARAGEIRNPTFADTDYESKVDTRPPMMPVTHALSFAALGVHVWVARLGSLLAILGTLPLVYLVGRELGYPWAGGVAALFLATDNLIFLAARTARPEAWVTFLGTLSLLFVLRSNARNSKLELFLGGVAAGLAANYHVAGLALGAVMCLLVLYQDGFQSLKQARFWCGMCGFALALAPFAIWIATSGVRTEAFFNMYMRGERISTATKLAAEATRLKDFLGFSSQRLPLNLPVPLRLHIALALLASVVILFRKKRPLFWLVILVVVPQWIWWMYLPNKTVRYVALAMPVLSLSLAIALESLAERRQAFRVGAAVLCLCAVSQVAGNGVVLLQARKADYVALEKRLRQAIPAGRVYGAITFAFAFEDRDYESYDRTPLSYAVEHKPPEYVITGDRVMMHGSGYGTDNLKDTRTVALRFVEEHGVLVSRIEDPFYGDLMIYRIPREAAR
jgi:4-amino-4-deoxy-L-arabinose transferase-like glycosyltransferase